MSHASSLSADLRVALVHHWLVRMRGGEKVLEALCKLFPQADIFTLVYSPQNVSPTIRQHRVMASRIQRLPAATRHYRYYLPLYPAAVEDFDLTPYDLVISSDASVVKGVITRPETCHICYCHSPMRYAWSAYHSYLQAPRFSWQRTLLSHLMSYLRTWDATASLRVDHFLANSQTVALRIRKFYRRAATVIYPPVQVSRFYVSSHVQNYFLLVGELVPYKRFDLAIEVFNQLHKPLWIVGEGPHYHRLRRQACRNICFLGRVSEQELGKLMSQCRALILPGEEDFGIAMVEANASGRPVIALDQGGAQEVITPGLNGLLFSEPTVASLTETLRHFEAVEPNFLPEQIREKTAFFSGDRFEEELMKFVSEKLRAHRMEFKAASRR